MGRSKLDFIEGACRSSFTIFLFLIAFSSISQTSDIDLTNYFLQSEIDDSNTAEALNYLTLEEQKVYLYTNLARKYPQKFEVFFRNFVIESGKEEKLTTNSYYSTLSNELKTKDPVGILHPDASMFELAKCWALESGKKGLVGHDRVKCLKGYDAENCAYGYSSAQNTVMQLLIDDGVSSLGHRKNIFHVEMKGLGVAIRPHRDIEVCTVQNFSRTSDFIKEESRKRTESFNEIIEEWDKREFKSADVNRKAKHLNDLEKDFYLYINLMRLNPRKFKDEIWDRGPYLDQLLSEQEIGVQTTAEYKMISEWLENTEPLEPIEPDKNIVSSLQCFIKGYLANSSNASGCFKGLSGSSSLRGYYSESRFDGIMSVLLTAGDFEQILVKESIVALHEGDPNIIAFFEEN